MSRRKRKPLTPDHPALVAAVHFSRAEFAFLLSPPCDANHSRLRRIAIQAKLDLYEAANNSGENPKRFERMATTAARSCKAAIEAAN